MSHYMKTIMFKSNHMEYQGISFLLYPVPSGRIALKTRWHFGKGMSITTPRYFKTYKGIHKAITDHLSYTQVPWSELKPVTDFFYEMAINYSVNFKEFNKKVGG